uniref:RING-type E3 ubiquitin transferase BRCA1 n=1 Tax=Manihot esculenta TaxID=3983 RepID=A0A251JLN8_MANES
MADSTKQNSVRTMNPWVLHLQKLGLELKCPLCLNFLKRPFLLPCDHIFCNACLPETTQFGPQCPVCKAQYVDRDLRLMPFIENMVTIYRSLDAAFFANLFQSSSSDTGRILEQYPTSKSADCNDKFCKEPFKAAREDNSNSGRSMFMLTSNNLAQVPLNGSAENGVQKIDMADKCNVTKHLKYKEYDMLASGGDKGDGEQNINSPPASSLIRAGGIQECSIMQIGMNQVDQLSAGSPPSFGDIKSSENDSNDQGGDSSPKNYQAMRLIKRNLDDSIRPERYDSFASRIDGVDTRDSKRHKKLSYGPLNVCTNNMNHMVASSQAENLGTNCCQSEDKSVPPHNGAQPLALLDDLSTGKIICEFCQSSRISKDTGPMAPQVYFVGENVKNLKAELARGAKLKCSSCGLKGAALGCYHKSCRRSYHVPCARAVAGCRWDFDDFLVLCPSHSSVRFPSEKKFKSKKHNLEHCHVPTQIAPKQSNFLSESLHGAEEWVFCGSALSSEEKCLLVEFGSMIGVPVTKFWKQNVTHVIAATDTKGACTRTLKVLMAILNGRWVLTIDWVKACMKSMCPVDEEPYEVGLDNHGCCNGPRTGRLSVLDKAPKLFDGLRFYFSGDFVLGYKEDLQNLVTTAGGTVLRIVEELVEKTHEPAAAAAPSKTIVVYNLDPPQGCKLGEEVSILWQRLNEAENLAAKIGSQVIGHTWVLESIASYKLQPFVSLHGIRDASNSIIEE